MKRLLLGLATGLLLIAAASAEEIWQTLPLPPAMPEPVESGMAPVNDIKMYYAVYGQGEPVLLIHGASAMPTSGASKSRRWQRPISSSSPTAAARVAAPAPRSPSAMR